MFENCVIEKNRSRLQLECCPSTNANIVDAEDEEGFGARKKSYIIVKSCVSKYFHCFMVVVRLYKNNIVLRSLINAQTYRRTHTHNKARPPSFFSLFEAQMSKINYKFHVSKAFTVNFLFVVNINALFFRFFNIFWGSLAVKTQWIRKTLCEAKQSVEFLFQENLKWKKSTWSILKIKKIPNLQNKARIKESFCNKTVSNIFSSISACIRVHLKVKNKYRYRRLVIYPYLSGFTPLFDPSRLRPAKLIILPSVSRFT